MVGRSTPHGTAPKGTLFGVAERGCYCCAIFCYFGVVSHHCCISNKLFAKNFNPEAHTTHLHIPPLHLPLIFFVVVGVI